MTQIRFLGKTEYARLRGLAGEPNEWIPSPECSQVVVAEKDGEIIGFWVAQLSLHLEPAWVKPEERGSTILGRMWEKMKGVLNGKPYYAFGTSDETSDYLSRLGFDRSDWKLFVGGK